jgi:hypothetical protein
MRKALFFLLGFSVFVDAARVAGGVAVTDIHRGAGFATVTLNGALQFQDVEILTKGGQALFQFPAYKAMAGWVRPQVVLRTPQAYDAIQKALKGTVVPRADGPRAGSSFVAADILTYTVGDVTLISRSRRRAHVSVLFNGAVEVTLGILRDRGPQGPYRVVYPSMKEGIYIEKVRILNLELKRDLEALVLRKFQWALLEAGGKIPR